MCAGVKDRENTEWPESCTVLQVYKAHAHKGFLTTPTTGIIKVFYICPFSSQLYFTHTHSHLSTSSLMSWFLSCCVYRVSETQWCMGGVELLKSLQLWFYTSLFPVWSVPSSKPRERVRAVLWFGTDTLKHRRDVKWATSNILAEHDVMLKSCICGQTQWGFKQLGEDVMQPGVTPPLAEFHTRKIFKRNSSHLVHVPSSTWCCLLFALKLECQVRCTPSSLVLYLWPAFCN